MRRQSFRRHLKASKSKKQLSNLKKTIQMVGYQAKRIRKFLGVTLREDKNK
jgi:ribosomal protein L35